MIGQRAHELFMYVAIAFGIAIALMLGGCQTTSVCDQCDRTFQGTGYYDVLRGEDSTLCPDCAHDYYAPLPYEQYAK